MKPSDRAQLAVDTLPLDPDGVRVRCDALPPTVWGSNVRALAERSPERGVWDRLRFATGDAAGNRCEACGVESSTPGGRPRRPDCHERWVFDLTGPVPVQRLDRLVALCPGCHEVQHLGRATTLGRRPVVLATLMRVNRWERIDAVADIIRADYRFRLVAEHRFDLDLSALTGTLVWPGRPDLYWPAAARAELGSTYRPPAALTA